MKKLKKTYTIEKFKKALDTATATVTKSNVGENWCGPEFENEPDGHQHSAWATMHFDWRITFDGIVIEDYFMLTYFPDTETFLTKPFWGAYWGNNPFVSDQQFDVLDDDGHPLSDDEIADIIKTHDGNLLWGDNVSQGCFDQLAEYGDKIFKEED
jgi:hypothetical protein